MEAALVAASAFDKLGVRWFLGGSLASSVAGVPRATLDADIVADLRQEHVKPLLAFLGTDWYADEVVIGEAITARTSFNLIHLDTAMKVDVFIPKRRAFDAHQFARAVKIPIAEGSDIELPVCVAEDIVVAKLEWFRLGGEQSERQWGDILGVLRINLGRLDLKLMEESARELAVSDLLAKAIDEAEKGSAE